jgi:hypothetical protein
MALEKAALRQLFHVNLRQLSQKLKFWESLRLVCYYNTEVVDLSRE